MGGATRSDKLKDDVAVVTGATQDIGKVIAEQLASGSGSHVITLGRQAQRPSVPSVARSSLDDRSDRRCRRPQGALVGIAIPSATSGERAVDGAKSVFRQWLRERKRSRKRTTALRNSGAVFLSPGKSGRTWVRAMLSQVCHLAFETPVDQLISDDNLHRLDKRAPSVLFTHGVDEPNALLRQLNAKGLRDKHVIALVRDPRDVLVSRYHHFHNRSARFARQHGGKQRPTSKAIGDFIRAGNRIERLVRRIDEFRTLAASVPSGHLFQYEAFRREPEAQLATLLRAIDCAVDDVHIAAAVEFARFENLKKREAESFYQTESMRPGDPSQPNSFKVRRGKVGGFRDELSPTEIAEIDARIDALLAPGLGYRSDEQKAAVNL